MACKDFLSKVMWVRVPLSSDENPSKQVTLKSKMKSFNFTQLFEKRKKIWKHLILDIHGIQYVYIKIMQRKCENKYGLCFHIIEIISEMGVRLSLFTFTFYFHFRFSLSHNWNNLRDGFATTTRIVRTGRTNMQIAVSFFYENFNLFSLSGIV